MYAEWKKEGGKCTWAHGNRDDLPGRPGLRVFGAGVEEEGAIDDVFRACLGRPRFFGVQVLGASVVDGGGKVAKAGAGGMRREMPERRAEMVGMALEMTARDSEID